MSRPPRGLPASISQRLLHLARTRGEDYQLVLTRYGLERLLARLGTSAHRDAFVLKGALLFALWSEQPHRATRDLDLLGRRTLEPEQLAEVFREIVVASAHDDGLKFDADGITGKRIREDGVYQGVRLVVPARLGKSRLRLQVDVGFGDAVHPRPKLIDYPTLLDLPAPRVRAYPREAVVAEKYEALVTLGLPNSRMKDLHDIASLAREFAFEGPTLTTAIAGTFRRRRTELPSRTPPPLAAEHVDDARRSGAHSSSARVWTRS